MNWLSLVNGVEWVEEEIRFGFWVSFSNDINFGTDTSLFYSPRAAGLPKFLVEFSELGNWALLSVSSKFLLSLMWNKDKLSDCSCISYISWIFYTKLYASFRYYSFLLSFLGVFYASKCSTITILFYFSFLPTSPLFSSRKEMDMWLWILLKVVSTFILQSSFVIVAFIRFSNSFDFSNRLSASALDR